MLFLTYWELNEDIPAQERIAAAKKLTSSGYFPAKEIKLLRWDLTPDNWGIVLIEADNALAVTHALNSWRMALPGTFKLTKTAPAVPMIEGMPAFQKTLEEVAAL